VPLTLGVALALALMVKGRLELAGLAVGLAMGFKYPGILLLVPLVVAGWKQWPRLAASIALAVMAFFASSPFILVHRHQAWHEAFRVQRLAREGWLGFEHDHIALIAFVDRLWQALRLPGPKRAFDENRSIVRLRRLGVEDVVVTGAVTDRVLDARSDYPREARFYDQLGARAKRIYYLQPGDDRAGPWVAVYRLP